MMSIGALLAQNVLASRSPAAASDKGTESLLGSPAKVRLILHRACSNQRAQARDGAMLEHTHGA